MEHKKSSGKSTLRKLWPFKNKEAPSRPSSPSSFGQQRPGSSTSTAHRRDQSTADSASTIGSALASVSAVVGAPGPVALAESSIESSVQVDAENVESKKEIAYSGVKQVLRLLEKCADGKPVPGLKGAVGGVLETMKICEVSSSDPEAFEERSDEVMSSGTRHKH